MMDSMGNVYMGENVPDEDRERLLKAMRDDANDVLAKMERSAAERLITDPHGVLKITGHSA